MQSKTLMKENVIDLLKSKLLPNYYYHNYEHTLYVFDNVIEIGRHENCTAIEIDLLCTAALWHDTGYIITYKGHEEASCILAKQNLPYYGYSDKDINKICGMIMATKILQTPNTKLEEILADADLEYLGSIYAAEKAQLLFNELFSLNPKLTAKEWNEIQISFLESHHYFTPYCKANKVKIKNEYYKLLLEKEKNL